MKTNWDIFLENSSSEEATLYFIKGKLTFYQFIKECWPKECKTAIKQMKHKGYDRCRRNARDAMVRRGYDLSDWDICEC